MLFEELFTVPEKDFTKHLKIPDNNRILFSSRFGMGKTTFLNYYFEQQKESVRYNAFHLYPVNYSISHNEDIFNYIKYDIIYEFLEKGIKVQNTDIEYLKSVPGFFKKNYLKIATALVYMIPKVGKDVMESYDKLKEISDLFIEYSQNDKKNSEEEVLNSYMEQIEQANGSIYDNSVITQMILNILQRLKNENVADSVTSKNVLIIDDLDRIDPEHLFRILNVFAAHFDCPKLQPERDNKFGFDKIILVCDVENVRNIFQAKYGGNSDFIGYIDKFYSTEIYYYDNKKNINGILNKFLPSTSERRSNDQEYFLIQTVLGNNSIVPYLMQEFITQNCINLRTLIKSYQKIPRIENEYFTLPSGTRMSFSENYPIILQFFYINDLLGGYYNFKLALNNFTTITAEYVPIQVICNRIFEIIAHKQRNYKPNKSDGLVSWDGEIFHIQDHGKSRSNTDTFQVMEVKEGQSENYEFSVKQFVMLVSELAELLNIIGVLR
ncbi:KAP family P-loop domain-containing protein [Chitinophaga costaii]|uniref:KAP family P-loop domain-containing protein n=1 Tax=Chitinophaga costaii TaxID=1335309 RepID=A0A1C4EX47_9BACT|nr:P-loop NTPase fold protein [Chitinophaga costaii]PUZ21578.1 hypothetical protein DCM91_16210 [Chitinophaga costaii]SCC48190.1 KAP family P-loop domain-containing protein [Chitinophaga costaii]